MTTDPHTPGQTWSSWALTPQKTTGYKEHTQELEEELAGLGCHKQAAIQPLRNPCESAGARLGSRYGNHSGSDCGLEARNETKGQCSVLLTR